MHTPYWKYWMAILSIFTLIAISLTLYCFIKRSKGREYNLYWKGFLALFIAGILNLCSFIIMPDTLNIIRRVTVVTLAICGFYVVRKGSKTGKLSDKTSDK